MNLLDSYVRVLLDDQVSSKLDGIVSSAVTKGNMLASAISGGIGAIQNAAGAVYNFGSSIIGAYSQFEQNVGGIETLFKNAADTVIENSRRAFSSAGVSMNQYMQQATSLASAMIQGVTKQAATATKESTQAASDSLDAMYKAQERAFSHQATAFQRQLSDQYSAQSKAYQKQYDAYAESLSKQVEEKQKANAKQLESSRDSYDREMADFERATDQRVKLMEAEYDRKIKLIDRETAARIKAYDDQIKALQGQGDADDAAQRESERAAKIAELQKRVETEKTYKKRQEAAHELAEYEEKIAKEDRDRERREQIEQLKDKRQEAKEEGAERKEQVKSQYSEEIAEYKKARAELLADMKETANQQLSVMQESQAKQLQEMQKANQERLAEYKEAQQEELKQLQRNQEDQMTAFRESQQDQLEALRGSIAERKTSMQNAAEESGSFVEATAEDYQRAAELVDMAIIDMSDNANKMGTDLGMIQAAYQGFSKQNFTMLDNLKLGFGGTKSEMERLLETAEQIKAKGGETVDYSVDNLADIVEAIHTVQTEYEISGYSLDEITQKLADQSLTEQDLKRVAQDMGISYEEAFKKMQEGSLTTNDALILTGTTSREANSTIEGALRSMGAAWENWLIALADPDTDIEQATDDLIERVAIAADNIVPRIGVIVEKLAKFLGEKGPELADTFKEHFLENLPEDMQEKFGEFMTGAQTAIEDFKAAVETAVEVSNKVKDFFQWIQDNGEKITAIVAGVVGVFVGLKTALLIQKAVEIFVGALGMAKFAVGLLKGGVFDLNSVMAMNPIALVVGLLAGLVTALIVAYNTNEDFRNKVNEVWENVKKAFTTAKEHIGEALGAVGEFFSNLKEGAERKLSDLSQTFSDISDGIKNFISDPLGFLESVGTNLVQGLINGIANGADAVATTLWNAAKGAYDTVCSWLGIASPSKRMREVGDYMMQGWSKGIEEEEEGTRKTMLGAAKSIYGATEGEIPVQGFGTATSSAILGGINIQIGEMVVREEADIHRVAEELQTLIRREQEARGWSTSFTMA